MLQRTFYINFKHYFLSFPRSHELTQNCPFDHRAYMQETSLVVDHYAEFVDYKKVWVALVSNRGSSQLILTQSQPLFESD